MKLPSIRNDYKAFETYGAVDLENKDLPLQLNCNVVSFGGAWDPAVSAEDISGWGLHTDKIYKAIEFPGSHFFYSEEMCSDPCVEELVKLSKQFEPLVEDVF
jgi:surfactin synthase thioesterase subunit